MFVQAGLCRTLSETTLLVFPRDYWHCALFFMPFHAILAGVALGTSCSEAQRSSNLAQCLQDIEALGLDIDKFWFGTSYATDCPGGPFSTIDCANPRPQDTRRSVFGRLFPTGYTGSLDRYLKMVFTSAPGNFM